MYDSAQMTIPEAEIREELNLLLQSKLFQQSQRLVRFLNFTVERAIASKLEDLKEYTIGVEVYDRGASFCPSLDSIVRGEARRLRAKLKEYYEGEGKNRPLAIYYRLGSYVPLFRRTESFVNLAAAAVPCHFHLTGGSNPVIAVLPFRDLSNKSETLALANGITDELIHLLTSRGPYRVVAASTLTTLQSQGLDAHSIGTRLGIQIWFDGCVKQEEVDIRITSSLVDHAGFQISSHRFETSDGDARQQFAFQERVASDLEDQLSMFLHKQSAQSASPLNFPNMNVFGARSTADLAKV